MKILTSPTSPNKTLISLKKILDLVDDVKSAGSGSVSVSDPDDINTPAINGITDRPDPAPNIYQNLHF